MVHATYRKLVYPLVSEESDFTAEKSIKRVDHVMDGWKLAGQEKTDPVQINNNSSIYLIVTLHGVEEKTPNLVEISKNSTK